MADGDRASSGITPTPSMIAVVPALAAASDARPSRFGMSFTQNDV
jgi:hypothetical protein